MIEVICGAHLHPTPEEKDADWKRIRESLAENESFERAVDGLEGPLSLTANNIPGPSRFGFFQKERPVFPPQQFVSVEIRNTSPSRGDARGPHAADCRSILLAAAGRLHRP
jgi:hypothetical protein